MQHAAGNRAVTRLLQRETYGATADTLGKLDIIYNFVAKRAGVLRLLEPYAKAIETGDHVTAYKLKSSVVHALTSFKGELGRILQKPDGKEDAERSLQWWLDDIGRHGAKVEETGRPGLIDADRKTGRILYGEPALTLEQGEKIMDQLRSGKPPQDASLKIAGEMAKALEGNPATREWGLGTLTHDVKSEAVIIAGGPDSTPFPSFPYLTPRAHVHPIKPHVKQKAVERSRRPTPAILRDKEAPLDKAFEDYSTFGVDLMPSVQDIEQTHERGFPHTVYVNYKLVAKESIVVNPAVPNNDRDLEGLPWIDFIISDTQKDTEGSGLRFSLTLIAGDTRLDFKNLRTDAGPWLIRAI